MGEDAAVLCETLGRKSLVGTRRYLRELSRGATTYVAPATTYVAGAMRTSLGESLSRTSPGDKGRRWREERVRHGRRRMQGRQMGNTYALKHGLYSKKKPEEILQALLAEQKVIGGEVVGLKAEMLGLRILLGQLFGQALEKVESTEELLKVLDGFGKNAVRLAALLGPRRSLNGEVGV
jgi:hypothetical protein